jgi:hypothetical protein
VALAETHVELKPGERVKVVGEEDHGRLLFQAIAGLRPWGAGRIARPPRESMIFVVRPEGAGYQWRKVPPGELSIVPVADERLGRVTGRAEAS